MSNPIDAVLQGLRARGHEPRKVASGWLCRCPAHDDHKPSLSIHVGDDGRVLLKCQAGCATRDVVAAIGLEMRDLFSSPNRDKATSRTGRRKIVATYPYVDEHGQLLYEVVRYEPKDFRQRRPDGSGGWIWNLNGTKRVLYHLPDLLKAASDSWIFIVEGEKDVDRLHIMGLTATCNPGGAGKWSKVDSSPLCGRSVAIFPDNDPVGLQHAHEVAASLNGQAADVRLITLPNLPPKGDVSNWFDEGGTVEEFWSFVNATPIWQPSPPAPTDDGPPTTGISDSTYKTDCPYEATPHGLVFHKPTRDGDVPISLTNFTAKIVCDTRHDDGAETIHLFEMEAKMGSVRTRFSVPATKFSTMNWPLEHLGATAMIFPGTTTKDHARAAIQMLSQESVSHKTIFAHTGWREAGREWLYLHAGGAIGRPGLDASHVQVQLTDGLELFRLPQPPYGQNLVQAVKASLQVLGVVPDRVGFPLLAAAYRSVLGPCSFSVHLAGQTGTGKSELAALIQQHFGPELHAKHLPASWSSTGNAIESLAFTVKDAILVVDDFAPHGSTHDAQRLHREADRVFRAQGNRSSRRRLTSDATLRPPKPPRGLILSTGEDVPRGHSVRARVAVIELDAKDMQWNVLTEMQSAASTGLLASAMAGYIQWLAARYEEIQHQRPGQITELRQQASDEGLHKRTPELIADLALGLHYFLRFAVDAGAITPHESQVLWDRGWAAFGELAQAQVTHHAASDPVKRFIELLSSALSCGHAHLAAPSGECPANPAAWGWRSKSASSLEVEWTPCGDRIGWIDGEEIYLDPAASYRVVQRMAAGSDEVALTAQTLKKRMAERGYLVTTDSSRQTLTIRRTLEGRRRDVLNLRRELLSPTENPTNPTIATDTHPQRSPLCSLDQGLWPGNGSGHRSGSADPSIKPDQETRPQPLVDAQVTPVQAESGRVGQVSPQGDQTSEIDSPSTTPRRVVL